MFSFTKLVSRRASPFAVYLKSVKSENWFRNAAQTERLALAARRYRALPPTSRAAIERAALASPFSPKVVRTRKAKVPTRARPASAYNKFVSKFLNAYQGNLTKGSDKLKLAAAAWKKNKTQ